MHTDLSPFEFRGFSHAWGHNYQSHTTWFGSHCTITPDSITVRVWKQEHVHRRGDLLELRWIDLPFPGFIAISRQDMHYIWSGFCLLRNPQLKEALAAYGYSFTSESRWAPISRQDIHKYGLYDAQGS